MIPGSPNPLLLTSADSGYEIGRSLRFNSGDSAYLNRTPSAAGNRRTWTWAAWVKFSAVSGSYGIFEAPFQSGGAGVLSDVFEIWYSSGTIYLSDSGTYYFESAAKFRDPSAWQHLTFICDTTQASASNRFKVYHNGVQLTNTASGTITQNLDTAVSNSVPHEIGRWRGASANAYLADVHFIDGQALAPTDFGETDEFGVWQPKKFAGTYGPLVDQSYTWSSSTGITDPDSTRSSAHIFNGVITGNQGTAEMRPYNATVTLANLVVANSSIRFYGAFENPTNVRYKVNSTTTDATPPAYVDNFTFQWAEVTNVSFPVTISSVGVTGGNVGNGGRLVAIEVDGKLLVDSGVSVTDNSFHLPFTDNSSNAALGTDTSGVSPANTWTVNNLSVAATSVTGTTSGYGNYGTTDPSILGNSSAAAESGFSQNSTYLTAATESSDAVITFNPPISASSTIYLYAARQPNGGEIVVNSGLSDETTTSMTGDSNFRYVSTGLTSITNIKMLRATSSSAILTGLQFFSSSNSISGRISFSTDAANIDSLVDTPTNGTQTDTGAGGEVVGNYATWNPLLGSGTKSNGNLVTTTPNAYSPDITTIAPSSGKWYAEITWNSGSYARIGIQNASVTSSDFGQDIYGWRYESNTGNFYNGSNGNLSSHSTFSNGDIVGIALDCDAGKVWVSKNGVYANSGNPANGANPAASNVPVGKAIAFACATGTNASVFTLNCGQRAFAYPVSGYKSLNTANLPDPTIADGSKYFDTKLWSGTSSAQSISSLAFAPDFVWIKRRSASYGNILVDTVRGLNNGHAGVLYSNATNAEDTGATQSVTAFNSNGFTLGTDGGVNLSGSTYAAWAWDAGSSNTTIAAGGLNSSAYDQSQTWSGQVSGTVYSSTYAKTNGFSGSISNQGILPANGQTLTFTPSPSFSNAKTVKIYYYYPSSHADAWKINGTSVGNDLATTGGSLTYTFNVEGSGFTSLAWSRNLHGSEDTGVYAIEVDGKILVDSTATPPNVPSIASTVRANPSAGFSIVSWTGTANATVGHGLNAEPKLVITKSRQYGTAWRIWSEYLTSPADRYLGFDTGAETTFSAYWGSMTSTTLAFPGIYDNNYGDMVAYCFAPVEGYSAMGSYQGNGNASGPFVYTGFKPRLVMIKASSFAGESWYIFDTARATYNVIGPVLVPNQSLAEFNADLLDVVSNGFKVRAVNTLHNTNGATYIYAAFAENPFKTARAR